MVKQETGRDSDQGCHLHGFLAWPGLGPSNTIRQSNPIRYKRSAHCRGDGLDAFGEVGVYFSQKGMPVGAESIEGHG